MRIIEFLAAATFLIACDASAQVFKCIDDQGVTHYSEHPPAGCASGVETLNLDPLVSFSGQGPEDYFSVINQARRMHEERIALERHRLEKRLLRRRLRNEVLYADELERAYAPPEPRRDPPVYVYPFPAHGFSPHRPRHPRLFFPRRAPEKRFDPHARKRSFKATPGGKREYLAK